jgi:hypothetical protein
MTTHRGQSWLLADRRILDPDDRASQQLLALAHSRQTRPLCQCLDGGVETYVARTPGGRYIIKRLPNSGPRHHPDCDSYEPPQWLSGRNSITREEDAAGATVLRLGFPLRRDKGEPSAAATRSDGAGHSPRHHVDPTGVVSLEALLHYLWDEAGFTRWSPKMAGKRNWSLIRYHLLRVAEQTIIDGQPLDQLTWIPEPFDRRHRDEIEARRQQAWEPLGQADSQHPGARRFGLAIVEWAEIKPARYGQAITIRQLARPPFMVDDDVIATLRVRFPQLDLHAQNDGGHLLMAATFSLSRGGYPVVEDAAFLATDAHWLPYDSPAGHQLLQTAVDGGRRFTTPLRYGMATSQPTPVLVLTDTLEPVAAYIVGDHAGADRGQQAAEDAGVTAWIWHSQQDMPPLPPAR